MGALEAQVVLEFTHSGPRFDYKLTWNQPLATLPCALMRLVCRRLIGIQLHNKSNVLSDNVEKRTNLGQQQISVKPAFIFLFTNLINVKLAFQVNQPLGHPHRELGIG